MCGIVGYFGPQLGSSAEENRRHLERAANSISHRGPDDQGIWQDREAGITLAHCRLSILDLTPAGHQPMASVCGRWMLIFNGEIYNHLELRRQLKLEPSIPCQSQDHTPARQWRGHSDTETILACFSQWGVERTLTAMGGMFALALWDRQERTLILARDRLGEKPLYYGWIGRGFSFASELKALRALPGFAGSIDRASLAAYVGSGQVPGPQSIYIGIQKVMPGHWLEIRAVDLGLHALPAQRPYWELTSIAQACRSRPLAFESDQQATDALEAVLAQAVDSQMLADVPLGAFLSGGVDSSTIVALMQRRAGRPVKTFTVGFHETRFNEAEHAKAVARHLGTDHRELYVDDHAARAVIPHLPTLYCEPFADSSQIPTYLVSKLAREQVTVSLSGDAGDELFGGYHRYTEAQRIWAAQQRVPQVIRKPLAKLLRWPAPQTWNWLFRRPRPLVPRRFRSQLPGDRIHKVADVLEYVTFIEMYRKGLTSYWRPDLVLNHDTDAPGVGGARGGQIADLEPIEQMMLDDANRYLPDDILVKVDRAAMGVSLETRVPMLDRRVVEFAWRLPMHYKMRAGVGKWLLREVLDRHVPRSLVERPKMGFGVPIDSWLRGSLRDWAENLLDETRLRQEGYFQPEPIRRRWREHLSGERNWQHHLWGILMFQAWLEAQAASMP